MFALTAVLAAGCQSWHDSLSQQHFTADFLNIAGMFEGNPITVLGSSWTP
ncbi:hypothetical protein ACFXG4_34955 [Nocardia sp. NPDC059246]